MNYIKLDTEDPVSQPSFRCSECNGIFQKPLVATLSSQGIVQTYDACPHCLSKVALVKHQQKREEKKEVLMPIEETKNISAPRERENADCMHFLGYLKTRSKDMSIPDECLTCDKMIECLMR